MEFYTPSHIVCCQCGVPIQSNSMNMCGTCLSTEIDITTVLTKNVLLSCCPKCERYNVPPNGWVKASLESEELLSLCLKRLKGLNKLNLIDASFIWTEPHSKRLKIKITVQKEVQIGAVLEQSTVIDYEVKSYQCPDCCRVAANDFWRAVVQIRQKTSNKKTLFYLEQLIMKYGAHKDALNMKSMHEGLDFYFGDKIHAIAFQQFVTKRLPCTNQTSKTLVSSDIHNNTHNCKYTYSIEIPPVNKDDVVVLPKNLAQKLGNIGQICIVDRVVERIHLIDPQTCQVAEVDAKTYFANPFYTIGGPKMLSTFEVVDTEVTSEGDRRLCAGHSRLSTRHIAMDAYVIKANYEGDQIHCRTHLGRYLRYGDLVSGFDIRNANINSFIFDAMKEEQVPDVVLVKKVYPASQRRRARKWRLQRLKQLDRGDDAELEEFKDDLEKDPELRKGVNIYKDVARQQSMDADGTDDEDRPQIPLHEMLDCLDLGESVAGASAAAEESMDME